MSYSDYHLHTNFCDGKNTPEEMVISAIEKGMAEIGLCHHGYTDFDLRYCIKKEREAEFIATARSLAEKYKSHIRVLCGVEQDVFSNENTDRFDYVIGSVHYLKNGDEYTPIDESIDWLKAVTEKHYGGNYYAMCRDYYKNVSLWANKKCDIIGHIDLVTKFIEREPLFDPECEEYLSAARAAIDVLIPKNIPFEINTGAISRGYRTTPYPSDTLRQYISSNGGQFILSSDAHSAENLCYDFELFTKRLM